MMEWLEDHVRFVSKTENFNGVEGGIWLSGENHDEYKGDVIYNYYCEVFTKYDLGVLKEWENELNQRGWYSEWHDAGTVMLYPV